MTWTLTPDWPKPPLSMNQRLHWAAKKDLTASIRQTVKLLAKNAKIPTLAHADVLMVWTVPTLHRRDADNPAPTLKAACDGLVDAGIVPDDTPQWMTKHMPFIEYERGVKAVRFEIRGDVWLGGAR